MNYFAISERSVWVFASVGNYSFQLSSSQLITVRQRKGSGNLSARHMLNSHFCLQKSEMLLDDIQTCRRDQLFLTPYNLCLALIFKPALLSWGIIYQSVPQALDVMPINRKVLGFDLQLSLSFKFFSLQMQSKLNVCNLREKDAESCYWKIFLKYCSIIKKTCL